VSPVFVTGGTGYLGRPLVAALLAKGYAVHALARPGSEGAVPEGAVVVPGNALEASSFASAIPPGATIVHLVGTPHPSPAKAAEFVRVDLASIRATAAAAARASARRIVYVSAAHPAPVMKAYIDVRVQGEALVAATEIPATILRPWYVLGPGHRWPYVLVPIYALLRAIPSTREGARRLGLVTHREMIAALIRAVTDPPRDGVRVVPVEEIRRLARDEGAL
jgi:uncharacterized protein YbjT (DUF2867 family)